MATLFRCGLAACALLTAYLLAGCGGGPNTLPVTGKVTKGGQPVEGAIVSFHPQSPEAKAATGTTDNSGTYKLTTFVNGDGAVPGSYKVTVTKFPGSGGASDPTAGASDIDAAYRAAEAQGQSVTAPQTMTTPTTPTPTNELPAKFASPDTSGLTADVASGSPNTFDFDVSGN